MEIQPANTQLQMKVANEAGGTEAISLSVEYHTY